MVSPAVGTVNRVQCIFKIQKKRGVPRDVGCRRSIRVANLFSVQFRGDLIFHS